MFTEQYRLTTGLSDWFNAEFYEGRVKDVLNTRLASRPEAQLCVKCVQQEYWVRPETPNSCIDVSGAVSHIAKSGSRCNKYFVVVVLNLIFRLKKWGFNEEDITVMATYEAQTAEHRAAHQKAGLTKVKVFTVDSMQGSQNKVTIFDITISRDRGGAGLGFSTDKRRLNVGASCSENLFILICDLATLDPDFSREERRYANLDEHEIEVRRTMDQDVQNFLRSLFQFYKTNGQIAHVDAEELPEWEIVDK